ncbi:hypothetical protein O3P69_013319 [Scylla paramamosain]|uniref:Uncharacterized protein n=1 Tax=Scylla paramamosain TaxID=85552 RepID=A0AAW0U0C8_SCYPA
MEWSRLLMVMVMVTAGRGQNHTNLLRQRLRETLLRNYSKEEIPRSHKELLILSLTSFTIRNLNMLEAKHRLQLHAWVGFSWTDPRLMWDDYDWDGIRKLSFSSGDLWLPDITFYNAAEADDMPLIPKTRLAVSNNGGVIFINPFDMAFSCVADLAYWPHDTHECRLKLGSWTHDGYTIEFSVGDALTTKLGSEVTVSRDGTMDTLSWEILNTAVKREELHYACCDEPYINLEVLFILQRKASIYNWLVKAPAACLILLTMVVFVLPPGAGEKITFGGICLLLNLLFLVFAHGTVNNAPNTTPLLVELVVVQMVVTAASVLIASWVVRAAQGSHITPPPMNVHSFSVRIAPAFCLHAYLRQHAAGQGQAEAAKDEEIEMGSLVGRGSRSEQSGIAAQWILFGAVLDRFALCIYLIVSLIILIRFLCVI